MTAFDAKEFVSRPPRLPFACQPLRKAGGLEFAFRMLCFLASFKFPSFLSLLAVGLAR